MKPMKILKIAIALIMLAGIQTIKAQHTFNNEIGQFERIKVDANVNVVYKTLPDSTGYARFTAPAGSENLYLLTVKGNGTLRVQLGQEIRENTVPPTLFIYSDFLSSVESSSDLNVYIENPVPCAVFNANQIGNGTIIVENVKCNNLTASLTTGNGSVNISGSCLNANLRMVGTGTIYADRLKADNVNCKTMGTGSIGCWALDNLTVKGLGTTKIYYKGKPNIKKTGGGKLFDLQDSDDDDYEKSGVPVTSFDNPDVNYNELQEDAEQGQEEDEDKDSDDDDDEDIDPDDDEYQTVVTQDD